MGNFHPSVKVVHLLLNTTLLIQSMGQGVTATLKKYLCHTFHQAVNQEQLWDSFGRSVTSTRHKKLTAWCEVTAITMNGLEVSLLAVCS